jgi:hypothetical protein
VRTHDTRFQVPSDATRIDVVYPLPDVDVKVCRAVDRSHIVVLRLLSALGISWDTLWQAPSQRYLALIHRANDPGA